MYNMTGYIGYYNQVPCLRTYAGVTEIDGADLADYVQLRNVRGQLLVTIEKITNQRTVASFRVTGGFGDWPMWPTQNYYYVPNSAVNCTVTEGPKNTLRVEVVAQGVDPAVTYVFWFSPAHSKGPQVFSENDLSGETIRVSLQKQNIIEWRQP